MSHKFNPNRKTDPIFAEFLSASEVQDALYDAGSKFVRVTFLKKNGDLASRVGRPKTYSRRIDPKTATPEQLAKSILASEALANNGNIFLDYPNPKEGESKGFAFNAGRVIGIGNSGYHLEEEA